MNKKHRIFAIAASAMLAFGSVGPAVMPVFAESTGNIKITTTDNNATKYNAYKIFTARVEQDNSNKIVSDISWANNSIYEKIKNVFPSTDRVNYSDAKIAANYIKNHMKDGNTVDSAETNETTKVKANTFASKLAVAIKDSGVTPTEISANSVVKLAQGYYLITTKEFSNSSTTNHVHTSPIFTAVGGEEVDVTEKTSIPTVDKKVTDDITASTPSDQADAEVGQNLTYTLIGSIPDNIKSYGTYYYKFTDTLTHLKYKNDSAKAYLAVKDQDGTIYNKTEIDGSYYSVSQKNNSTDNLTVTFPNLRNIASKATDSQNSTILDADSSHVIVVEYQAAINAEDDNYVVGPGDASNKNKNTVNLTYSNNPLTSGDGKSNPAPDTPVDNDHPNTPPTEPTNPGDTGTTTDKTVYTYTFGIKLTKEDSTNSNTKLQGAKFTIQSADNNDGNENKYVQENGTLGGTTDSDKHEFTTNENGLIEVKGLDAGTYKVTETEAPSKYNLLETSDHSFTFTINATYNSNGSINTITAEPATETNGVTASAETNNNNPTGYINLTVKDTKGISLPLTGQQGITFGIVVGGIVVAVSVVAVVRNRKKAEEE